MSESNPLAYLSLEPLPRGWTATGAVALIKCIDGNGSESWSFRTSEELSEEEVIGALRIRLLLQERATLENFLPQE